jgi:hypothetical protein
VNPRGFDEFHGSGNLPESGQIAILTIIVELPSMFWVNKGGATMLVVPWSAI